MSRSVSLPEVLTRSDFAAVTGREPRSIELMASRGLVADPTHRNRGKYVWEEASALEWFRMLHEHAVVVPANDLAEEELARYNAYLCPLSSSHVGLARPRFLAMYKPGGQGRVFGVTAVETIHQQVPGTRSTTAVTRSIMREGETLDASRKPWTVFYLSEAGTIDKITPVIQQGRYVPVGHVRKAVASGSLVVPTLDEAFPARK
ncbi:hypothetical protein ACFU99_06905 [Streptomyces sp. NPDC057654]|uniref:hypothetical protein n=1 Tax=Streptomyces sp. NPDC057654 TaxID=3346196 RepID=UPI0036A2991A